MPRLKTLIDNVRGESDSNGYTDGAGNDTDTDDRSTDLNDRRRTKRSLDDDTQTVARDYTIEGDVELDSNTVVQYRTNDRVHTIDTFQDYATFVISAMWSRVQYKNSLYVLNRKVDSIGRIVDSNRIIQSYTSLLEQTPAYSAHLCDIICHGVTAVFYFNRLFIDDIVCKITDTSSIIEPCVVVRGTLGSVTVAPTLLVSPFMVTRILDDRTADGVPVTFAESVYRRYDELSGGDRSFRAEGHVTEIDPMVFDRLCGLFVLVDHTASHMIDEYLGKTTDYVEHRGFVKPNLTLLNSLFEVSVDRDEFHTRKDYDGSLGDRLPSSPVPAALYGGVSDGDLGTGGMSYNDQITKMRSAISSLY